ncbi:MAG: hypothetical protein QOH67_2476 [Hyphomicrobiales bacterium]|jgi:uncharacterized LabA/DUF88 family protein|nr:hypothetical protein [Hyphomicrobiales bacterium]
MAIYPGVPSPTQHAYIDGAYLRQRLAEYSRRYFGAAQIEIDYERMFTGCEKKFYYDCLPPRLGNETDEAFRAREASIRTFFDSLSELPGFHVYEGKIAGQGERARQKGVDVALAVHMLSQAVQGTVRKFTLVAGDADFEPLAHAVVQAGAYLTLWADRKSVAKSLVRAVDVLQPITVNQLLGWASQTFRAAHPMPELSQLFTIEPDGLALARTGTLSNGHEAFLYTGNGRTFVIYRSSATHFMHIRWHTPEAAMDLAADLGADIQWTPDRFVHVRSRRGQ